MENSKLRVIELLPVGSNQAESYRLVLFFYTSAGWPIQDVEKHFFLKLSVARSQQFSCRKFYGYARIFKNSAIFNIFNDDRALFWSLISGDKSDPL